MKASMEEEGNKTGVGLGMNNSVDGDTKRAFT